MLLSCPAEERNVRSKTIIVCANESCLTDWDFAPQYVKECNELSRLVLAALGVTIASFAFGSLVFVLVPALIKEGHKYPAVFRPKEEMMTVMPIGSVATFISILVAAVIFAMIHQGGWALSKVRASACSLAFSWFAHLCCTTT
jgi:hypothetical protein